MNYYLYTLYLLMALLYRYALPYFNYVARGRERYRLYSCVVEAFDFPLVCFVMISDITTDIFIWCVL